jgi:hypothetical protein
MSQLASPTLAPLKVISSLLSRFESVVCAMVLSNPESESTVRSEDKKRKSEIFQIESGIMATEDIRIFENKA